MSQMEETASCPLSICSHLLPYCDQILFWLCSDQVKDDISQLCLHPGVAT